MGFIPGRNCLMHWLRPRCSLSGRLGDRLMHEALMLHAHSWLLHVHLLHAHGLIHGSGLHEGADTRMHLVGHHWLWLWHWL